MTPDQIDRVFGRGRLKMVTGDHVEVFREAVAPGERRRYTKRFLNSTEGDYAHWTEREWRILARLIGHGITCVPDVVQFDRGSVAGTQLVQTYDAGVTVDQWATLLPLYRDGRLYRHAFEDCAHWWALAHHCLVALKEIHQLQLVHLDVKGDNVCIPVGPANFDPDAPGLPLYPLFRQLALIDFAFALVSRESLDAPLPIGWQKEYDYQSPRLLKALEDGHDGDLRRTRELDWRCDIYSLAAMLKRYLPEQEMVRQPGRATGWTSERYDAAKALILTLRDHHDRDAPQRHPHEGLIAVTAARLREKDLALSLASGWTLARDISVAAAGASPLTPMTRLAPPLRVFVSPRTRVTTGARVAVAAPGETTVPLLITKRDDAVRPPLRRIGARHAALASAMMVAFGTVVAYQAFPDAARALMEDAYTWIDNKVAQVDSALAPADTGRSHSASAAPGTSAAQGPEAPPSATATPAEAPPGANSAAAEAPPGTAAATADAPPGTSAAAAPPGATAAAAGARPGATAASGEAPAGTTAASGEAPAGTTAASGEAPRASTPAPNPVPGARSVASGDRVADPPATRTAETNDGVAALPNRRPYAARSPPISRTHAPPPNETARAPGKRVATKSTPTSPARLSTPVAATKSLAGGRLAMQDQRVPPANTGTSSSVKSSPEQAPAAEPTPAPMQLAQLAPQTAHVTPPEPPSPPVQVPPHEVIPPSSPAANQEPHPSVQPSAVQPPVQPPSVQLSSAQPSSAQPSSARESRSSAIPVSPPAAGRERVPSASDDSRAEGGILSQLFGLAKRRPAPIEERSAQAVAPPSKASRAPPTPSLPQAPSSPQDRLALAGPKANAPPPALSPISIARADEQASAQSSQPPSPPPPATRDERLPPIAPPISEKRSPPPPPVREEPKLGRPEELGATAQPSLTPAPRVLSPPPAKPGPPAEYLSSDRAREIDFAMQGRRTLALAVPRIAAQSQSEIDRVLWAAANAYDPRQERAVVDVAQSVWVRENASGPSQVLEPGPARRLNDEAQRAYWIRRNVAEAFDLQLKAFGANPDDPEVAGNLAFLHLKVSPMQPETARQLALHAIAVRGSRFRTGRLEDWNTYAVASALTGRGADARNAMYVMVALARNVERNCKDAASAIASYGDRVREPVEAMLYRIYMQGRAYDTAYCTWPPNRAAGVRLQ